MSFEKTKRLSLIVPTVGRSELLDRCLAALRQDAGADAEIVVVAQGEAADLDFGTAPDRVIRCPEKLGFAAANNLGFRETSGLYVGTINDDAVVEPGFCALLCAVLDENPRATAVQGLNLQLQDPSKVDGGGIGWNRDGQAVQIGIGQTPESLPASACEVFGASATAVIYRRTALEQTAEKAGEFFAEVLFTYYEDVELAVRLRRAHFEAWLEPRARALHAGSASLSTLRHGGRELIHGNRWPVVASLLGRSFLSRLPRMVLRELRDVAKLGLQGNFAGAWGVLLGARRGWRLLPRFRHKGPSIWPLARLESSLAPRAWPRPVGPLLLTGIVVHWNNEAELAELVAAWPQDPRCELVVVDNSGTLPKEAPASWLGKARLVDPGGNRGFAGGVNAGVAASKAPWVLVLNPDAHPLAGAIESLLEACEKEHSAAGLVPALVWPDGSSQCSWQLQPLPSAMDLLLQIFFLAGRRGPKVEPEAGAVIGQPAAAALALRRQALEELGGLDEGFFPAWFEDVDLARRLAHRGDLCLYLPKSRFEHAAGSSVPALGYGRFLWIYYRHLCRYLEKHHGVSVALLARLLLPLSMFLRLLLLPLRRPKRANTRREAAAGLLAVAWGALTGFRRPRELAARFTGTDRRCELSPQED